MDRTDGFKNTFHHNTFETGLIRKGRNWRTELMLVHLPGSQTELCLATFRLNNNPNNNPTAQIDLSIEEARLLRDLLNRPEMQAYLEQ